MRTVSVIGLVTIFLFSSCASVKVSGETRVRLMKIGTIERKCESLKGKKVVIRAKFMGWNCPKECKNPGITRSDTCFVDSTGCIYAEGLAGDPLTERGKEYLVKAIVMKRKNTCYLKVLGKDEVR